ncbi:MAG: spinster family MFS transporter [Caulobacteraceae bacterium]
MDPDLVKPKARPAWRYYVLGLFTLAYAFGHVDRSIVGVLLPAIRREFAVSDAALAFLSGLAFAIFFVLLGIPIAVLADRGNRRRIAALSVALWSAMTAICGVAGSFAQLLAARIGVGVGEAGLTPPTHSMLSDLFPPKQRAFAIGVYSAGVYLGVLVGFALGGFLVQHLGWRRTFFVVGLPGLAVAALIQFTVAEPERGHSDDELSHLTTYSGLGEVLRHLWYTRSLRYALLGIALCAMANQTQGVWLPSFLVRSHHLSIAKAGLLLGLAAGVGGAAGTIAGGRLSDVLGMRDERWRLWVASVAMLLTPFCSVAVLFVHNVVILAITMTLGAALSAVHLAPTAAVIQNLTPLRMRARAAAIAIFIINLLGLGVGPLIVGSLSDYLRPILGAESLRYALTPVILFALLSAPIYFLAGRALGARAGAARGGAA